MQLAKANKAFISTLKNHKQSPVNIFSSFSISEFALSEMFPVRIFFSNSNVSPCKIILVILFLKFTKFFSMQLLVKT